MTDSDLLVETLKQSRRGERFWKAVALVTLTVSLVIGGRQNVENHKLANLARENHRGMEAIVQATGPDATARSNTILGYFSSQLSALCVEVHAACPAPPPVLTTPPEAKR